MQYRYLIIRTNSHLNLIEKYINLIIKYIFQIHGEVNILHDLVLAFIECGRLRQARRILETPGLHTKQKRLQDACERYVDVINTLFILNVYL